MSEHIEKAGPAGRAVITFSRGWQTLVATRSLGRRGVQVVTGDEYRMTAASFSRYSIEEFRYPNPTKEPEAFLDALEIPQQDGVIDEAVDLEPLDADRLVTAAAGVREQFPTDEVEIYLATLVAMDPEIWQGLTEAR